MSKKLSGILTIVAAVIGVIGFIFFIRIVNVGDEAIENDVAVQASMVSPFVSFAIFVLIATAVITVLFSIVNLIKHPAVLKRSLMVLGIMAVILILAYSFASDAAVTDSVGNVLKEGQAGSVSKWVSTLINYSFVLGAVGLIMVVADFVKGFVK